ncbi:Appr-1-p processing protein (plasmid) [Streptomyces globosus]|uniref:Appr-1-p processing protein n=1 Tax=Streptomyces globosus TaxID=68209 RepID=A0A344UBM9_9ACTN|nr:macro domain-containing protein [Streptomyces globosus]AXE28300.1 Appr-1-p processing protein [Streptomyces globosus]
MIVYAEGNLLTAEVDALVNTVNTVGVMGKGIALQFKRAYPDNFHAYAEACAAGEVHPGRMHVHARNTLTAPRYIINFPTKRHWRSPSRLEDVEQGLQDLRKVIVDLEIESIAVPPLGCGNGGLPWDQVHPLILAALADLPDVEVRVYAPHGAPPATSMPNNQNAPELNRERAAFLVALDCYISRGLASGFIVDRRATLLEAHKLVYLLQCVGFSLGLRFSKGHYGPYSPDLDRAVASLEGHYISGYGDGTIGASAPLVPEPEAVASGAQLLRGDADFQTALQRLEHLVDGYEHPYGMELLGTLLFASQALASHGATFAETAAYVKQWTPRKQRMFTDAHLTAAWERLTACSLTPALV